MILMTEAEIPCASSEIEPRQREDRVKRVLVECSQARLLLRELDLAAAMLELARIAQDFGTVRRNYMHARQSYEAALVLLPSLTLSDEQAQDIHNWLLQLAGWLDSLGSRFQSN